MSGEKSGIVGPHIVRFGIAPEQEFLLGEFLSTYDQLVINANMVAHMPAALAAFVSQKAKGKPYFVDPQTHAFQHDMSFLLSDSSRREGQLKRSFQVLVEAYGAPVSSTVGLSSNPRPLTPSIKPRR